jgi:sulfur carrier protein
MGKVQVEVLGEIKEVEIKKDSIRVDNLLEKLGFFPETAVVLRNGELLCDDDRVKSGEKVKIIVATSRG